MPGRQSHEKAVRRSARTAFFLHADGLIAVPKQATRNAEFIGGGGLRTHITGVPLCPSAQPQGGLSLPPELRPFLLGQSQMRQMKEAAN